MFKKDLKELEIIPFWKLIKVDIKINDEFKSASYLKCFCAND